MRVIIGALDAIEFGIDSFHLVEDVAKGGFVSDASF